MVLSSISKVKEEDVKTVMTVSPLFFHDFPVISLR